ncbi:unnamed protein product [Clonostachys chloroleuca]|uniref:Uncharacterized protein n=1 Tax=Clonostachys chloroleuca TaxID=1926264 RepID=A0AA35LU42_9HYPO|nr:unnamed protein product [Clonostachys chloroleuca]
MTLATIFDSACEEEDKMKPYPGLGEALEGIQYLADKGNTIAIARLEEVQSTWSLLVEHYQLDNVAIPQTNKCPTIGEQAISQGRRNSKRIDGPGNIYPEAVHQHHTEQLAHSVAEQDNTGYANLAPVPPLTDLWADISQLFEDNHNPADESMAVSSLSASLDRGFQSLLYGFDSRFEWDLVGHDDEDFAEFGRYMADFVS